jgi:hypothetical protein
MKGLIGLAASLLAVPVIAASTATTAAASTTIARAGQAWTVTGRAIGCENVKLEAAHKFIADLSGDKGTWTEPSASTITLDWTAGEDATTVFKGTFSAGHYSGHITWPNASQDSARLIPGPHSAC